MATKTKITISAEDKTRRAFKTVNHGLSGVGSSIVSVQGKLLALVGGAGMGALVKRSIEVGDTLQKTSDKLGITVEALQEMRFAAQLTGVPVEALDVGMQRFTRRVAEAAQGSGVLKDVFKELNIPLRDANGTMRTTESILDDYADAIQGAESSQQQLLLAFKAFDTEGAAMVNTLRNGSDGLAELRQQARDTGAIMSTTLADTAAVINDRWTVLVDTIGNKFNIAALSAVDSALNMFGVFNNLGDVQGRLIEVEDLLLEAEIRREGQTSRMKRATGQRIVGLQEEQTELQKLEKTITEARMARENLAGMGGVDLGGATGDGNSAAAQSEEARALKEEQSDRERLSAKFQRLSESLMSEQERLQLGFEEKEFLIEEAFQESLITESERKQALLDINEDYENSITEKNKRSMKDRLKNEQLISKQITAMRFSVAQQAIGFLQLVSGKNEAVGKLIIVAQKGLAIAQTVINTEVAAVRALAELGPIAGPPAAATIRGIGAASIALIGATGIAQLAGVGGGGSGIGGVPVGNTSSNTPAPLPTFTDNAAQNSEQEIVKTYNITVNGVLTQEIVDDVLVPAIREGVDDRDVILISGNSRNAQELVLA